MSPRTPATRREKLTEVKTPSMPVRITRERRQCGMLAPATIPAPRRPEARIRHAHDAQGASIGEPRPVPAVDRPAKQCSLQHGFA